MREHSRSELMSKLLSKDFAKDLCELQLDKYVQANLLSEQRFAEVLVRSRVGKGVGEQRIRRELAEHEIPQELIEAAFAEHATDWQELVRRVYVKKYGQTAPESWQEQQKRQRFLLYRGFSYEQIRQVSQLFAK